MHFTNIGHRLRRLCRRNLPPRATDSSAPCAESMPLIEASPPATAAAGIGAAVLPAPPEYAAGLIELRDWVLLVRCGGIAEPDVAFDKVQEWLRKILQQAGLTSLEEGGALNSDHQRVNDTVPTSDPALHEMIRDTVRPGYRFEGRLVRPQEVNVLVYQASGSVGAPAANSSRSENLEAFQ